MLTLIRRLLGSALIAVVAATSTAPHSHPLRELTGELSAGAEQAVTTHDPHSRASHWHAVIRFVKEDPCLACQWQQPRTRLLPGGGRSSAVVRCLSARLRSSGCVRSTSLGRPSSRGPPALL